MRIVELSRLSMSRLLDETTILLFPILLKVNISVRAIFIIKGLP